jgi:DNA-binding transcriptional MocR family regulator
VQTERAAHEAWGRLTMKSPRAAALMHRLVSMMGHQNAVVVSQKTLAKLVGCSLDTIKRAVRELESERWIDVVRINGPGTVAAYVVNSAVAWGERRDLIGVLSVFHATVIADAEDQPEGALERKDLRRVPIIVPPEEALLAGEGEPGAQIALPGMEPVVVRAPAAPAEKTARADTPAEERSAQLDNPPTEGVPDPRATLAQIRAQRAADRKRERQMEAKRLRREQESKAQPLCDDDKE